MLIVYTSLIHNINIQKKIYNIDLIRNRSFYFEYKLSRERERKEFDIIKSIC